MTEEEILQRWAAEKPIYEAWADLIKGTICQELSEAITPVSLDYFFKVPVQCRLKADSTLVDKALVRKKYDDPYDDITDKVGMRFVVLLTTDISKICEVIEGERGQLIWEASKDRDYEGVATGKTTRVLISIRSLRASSKERSKAHGA